VASAPDERLALDLAEAHGEREAAREMVGIAQQWTRDLLVFQAGGTIEPAELAELAQRISSRSSPLRLLEQAAACADALEALDQNGNGRLQLERLFLRVRESRRG